MSKGNDNVSDSQNKRVFGLTRRDQLVLFVMSVTFVLIAWGGWLIRRSREAALPSEDAAIIRVDINSAGPHELTLLPGIGDKTARLIVEDREKNGPFKAVDDLSRVKGIGRSTVERITPFAKCG